MNETVIRFFFLDPLNEIGGAVGLTEFNLMTHGLHVDRQLIWLLSQFISRSFCFFFFRRTEFSLLIAVLLPVEAFFEGNYRQCIGQQFGHGSFLSFLAPDDQILSGTGEGYIKQVEIVYPQLKTFQQIIVPIDGFGHLCRVIDGKDIHGIERSFLRGTPYQLVIRFILQFPVAEGKEYCMKFQSFGFVDGEDSDTFHFTAGNGFAAQRLIPVADKTVELRGVTLQIIRYGIEEGKQIGILFFNVTHFEDAE